MNSKKKRRSKRATNTHKHGRSSYLSVGTGGDVQTLLEAEPLRSKDRGLFTYNIDICETWKKRDMLTEKQETGMTLEKRDFLTISDNVDTYAIQ